MMHQAKPTKLPSANNNTLLPPFPAHLTSPDLTQAPAHKCLSCLAIPMPAKTASGSSFIASRHAAPGPSAGWRRPRGCSRLRFCRRPWGWCQYTHVSPCWLFAIGNRSGGEESTCDKQGLGSVGDRVAGNNESGKAERWEGVGRKGRRAAYICLPP